MAISSLSAEIVRLLSDERRPRAVLLTAPWGAGKTWLWENEIKNSIQATTPAERISLFGAESLDHVAKRLLGRLLLQGNEAKVNQAQLDDFMDRIKLIGKRFIKYKFSVDLTNSLFEPLELVRRRSIVCIDDLERAPSSLSLATIAGLIDFLVLEKKCSVLALANGEAISGRSEWSSLAEKTFHSQLSLQPKGDTIVRVIEQEGGGVLRPLHVSVLHDGFARFGGDNLRRLGRASRMSAAVVQRVGPEKLTAEATQFLYAMICERESTSWPRSDEFYRDAGQKLLAFAGPQGPVNIDLEREFLKKYFGTALGYPYYESLFNYATRGHVGTELELQLSPKPLELTEAEALYSELHGSSRWFEKTDADISIWCRRAEAAIASEVLIHPELLLALVGYLKLGGNVLGEDLITRLDARIRSRLSSAALHKEVGSNIYASSTTLDADFESAVSPYRKLWQDSRETVEESRAREVLIKAVQDDDLMAVGRVLSTSRGAEVFFADKLYRQVLAKFDANRGFVIRVLDVIVERPGGNASQRRELTAAVAALASTTDTTGKYWANKLAGELGEE